MSDSFFRDDLSGNDSVLEEKKEDQSQKLFSKIDNRFSDDHKNTKILIFVGFLALILGFWNLISQVKNAFVVAPIVLEDKSGVIENLNNLKDTDGDGLSDYDERYVYGTSPYLSDTDSDGISDLEEIMSGQEPLCAGENCGSESEDTTENISDDLDFSSGVIMNLSDLKNELIQAGYPEEEVNKLSEEDLSLIYEEAKKAVNDENYNYNDLNNSLIEKSDDNSPSPEELEQLKNLSIVQIKELLIQGGANQEQLESVSEEELKNLYLQILEEL